MKNRFRLGSDQTLLHTKALKFFFLKPSPHLSLTSHHNYSSYCSKSQRTIAAVLLLLLAFLVRASGQTPTKSIAGKPKRRAGGDPGGPSFAPLYLFTTSCANCTTITTKYTPPTIVQLAQKILHPNNCATCTTLHAQ